MTTRSQYTVVQRGRALLRRFARERDGAALVEFAIIVALLLVVVMGTLSWSYYFFVRANLTNAVREGARLGAVLVSRDTGQIATRARNVIADTRVRSRTTVLVTFPGDSTVRVKVSSSYKPFTYLVIKQDTVIRDSAQFRLEYP